MSMKKKILIADDEPDSVKVLSMRLRACGYQVIAAYDGAQTIRLARQEKPNLIVLDIKMAGVSGFTVYQSLRETVCTRTIPIVFFSALPPDLAQEKASQMDADGFISKSADPKEIVSTIREVLGPLQCAGANEQQSYRRIRQPGSRQRAKLMSMRRILIIDDEEDMVTLLSKGLVAHGYEVMTAANGWDGLALARLEKPDLILLDNVMPKMDGATTLASLKAVTETKNIPVVMLTALSDKKSINEALQNGAASYVVKPFELDLLLKKIGNVLNSEHPACSPPITNSCQSVSE